jgi:hypothetical protein
VFYLETEVKEQVKTNALMGIEVLLGERLPPLKCPKIKDLDKQFFQYLYFTNSFISLYDERKEDLFFDLLSSEKAIGEFLYFVKFFYNFESFDFKNSTFFFDENYRITHDNIGLFMDCVKVLHHKDSKSDNYKFQNKLAEKFMERANKLKKEIEEKKRNLNVGKKNEIGLFEIISSVCARHPSINLLNVNELSYFQLIEQYQRLMRIDKYTPFIVGNGTEEYAKTTKHYLEKIENE